MFFKALAALCASATLVAAGAQAPSTSFTWGSTTIKGVNIGGWLVMEPWITPSMFANLPSWVVDEFTFGQYYSSNPSDGFNAISQHWNTWATAADFQKIAASGFNTVRIPIGFWAYDNAGLPFISGSAGYMDSAIGWARQYGLKVIIDLHGAPGSQNGFDNSGQKMSAPQWGQGNTVQRTLNVLSTIQSKYGDGSYDDVVIGIELLNEPLTPELDMGTVQQFYRNGYGQQRSTAQNRVVVLQDGFQQVSYWNGFLSTSDNNAQNVAMDHHEYQVFNDGLVALQPWQHRQLVCNNAGQYDDSDKWTFVGEWSAAFTDCALWLNGRNVGARFDGSFSGGAPNGACNGREDIGSWDTDLRNDIRGYIEAQMEAFEHYTNGWIFWNFKTENSGAGEWDAFALIDAGIFPQPLDNRMFGPVCSF